MKKTVIAFVVVESYKDDGREIKEIRFSTAERAQAYAQEAENDNFHYEVYKVTSEYEAVETKEVKDQPKETSSKDVKKAWEQMKKELKKEFPNEDGLHYNFTMNKKQIENRTATFLASVNHCYEGEYADADLIARFGTAMNEARTYLEMIQNSKSFAKFSSTVGNVRMTIESGKTCNNIRFNY